MNCNCLTEVDDRLKEKGFRLSPKLMLFELTDLSLNLAVGWPLERLDGSRMKREDPKHMQVSYCPFCGKKTAKEEQKEEAK